MTKIAVFLLSLLLGISCALKTNEKSVASLGRPQISFTFDDGITTDMPGGYPFEKWNALILQHLEKEQVKAVFFVTGSNKTEEKGRFLLESWNAAGHRIGNHTYSHPSYNNSKISFQDFEQEFLKTDSIISRYPQYIKLFRFPYLKEGNTPEKIAQFRSLLQAHDYRNGYVTIDASDWAIDSRLRKRLRENPQADLTTFRKFYLEHLYDRAMYYENLGQQVTGRHIPHTLLLHHNLAAAMFLDDLIALFRAKGWDIIAADTAFKDEIFASIPTNVPAGESLIWALAKQSGQYESILRYPAEDESYEKEKMDALGCKDHSRALTLTFSISAPINQSPIPQSPTQMDSLQHQIALMLVPQVGAVTAKTLVSYCGSAEAVFRASKRELQKIPGIGPNTLTALVSSGEPLSLAEREIHFMEKNSVEAIFYTDPRYPARLRQCQDSPALFFFKGSSQALFEAPRVIAIIGTRQPSDHGKAICEEIVEGLLDYNVLIISGLAFGVDVTAHRKATTVGIPNIGVLGHGLGSIYPSQHRNVAQRMIENGGLLSEYVHDAKPDREHFPMRNRIISGLSDVVLVVETANSGGSMITVQCAERHGREIFAVPGRPHDTKSMGCNLLLKTERAKLAESAADIAQRMQWGEPGKPGVGKSIQAQLFPDLSPRETTLVGIIRDSPEIPIDQLTRTAEYTPGELASHILALEFKGIIRTLPGKRYIVC